MRVFHSKEQQWEKTKHDKDILVKYQRLSHYKHSFILDSRFLQKRKIINQKHALIIHYIERFPISRLCVIHRKPMQLFHHRYLVQTCIVVWYRLIIHWLVAFLVYKPESGFLTEMSFLLFLCIFLLYHRFWKWNWLVVVLLWALWRFSISLAFSCAFGLCAIVFMFVMIRYSIKSRINCRSVILKVPIPFTLLLHQIVENQLFVNFTRHQMEFW